MSIIGIPPGIRTPTIGFGDRYAAVNTSEIYWSRWRDSNSRPTAPKAVALPDCATPRQLERGAGIEPATLAWKARVIPFYEPRKLVPIDGIEPPTS
jgi:hypothetical protein